jgi:hypothetical protein
MATDKRKPTFGAPPIDDLGKNAWRDIHNGRWSCAKRYGAGHGQSDPYLGVFIQPASDREPFKQDLTLPTPTKDEAS